MNASRTALAGRVAAGNAHKAPRKRLAVGAFTLVEVLVVSAIIALLASLFLPSLARAKSKSRDLTCMSHLRQLGVGVRLFADENNGLLPEAEPLPTMPLNPAHPLPRICDLLAPYVGYLTNELPAGETVFRCPRDTAKRFEQNGASYEWNAAYGGRPVDSPRHSPNPIGDAPLMYDYENFHSGSTNATKHVLFADYHVAPL